MTGVEVDVAGGARTTFRARHRRRLGGCRELRQAAARVGQRPAPERPRQRLRPGRPQLHVPQQHGRPGDLEGAEPDEVPEDARRQRLLLRDARLRVPDGQHPDGRQVRPRRCSAARSRSRRSSRRRSRSTRSPSTPSTSGSRPRTCPRPENRVTLAARRQHHAQLHATTTRSRRSSCTTSSSRCSATWACTPTTCCRARPTSRTTSRSPASPTRSGTVAVRDGPGHVGPRRQLQGARARQPVRRRHELLPEHRGGEPGPDGDGQRLRVGDHLLERLGASSGREAVGGRRRVTAT